MVRIARLILLIASPIAVYIAMIQYDALEIAQSRRAQIENSLSTVDMETVDLKAASSKPLVGKQEALEELLARLIDDTELLGSSVRLEIANSGLVWQPIKYGIEKAPISISSAAELSSGLGYFHLLWELIEDRPVSVISGKIMVQEDVVSFDVDMEVFGLTDGYAP